MTRPACSPPGTQVAHFAGIPLDISDFPTRHPYGLALWQNHIERTLADWSGELKVPIYRGREVTGFEQDGTGVDVQLSDSQPTLINLASPATSTSLHGRTGSS